MNPAKCYVYRLFSVSALFAAITLLASVEATAQTTFDHFSTGFELDGAHINVTCESCHVGVLRVAWYVRHSSPPAMSRLTESAPTVTLQQVGPLFHSWITRH